MQQIAISAYNRENGTGGIAGSPIIINDCTLREGEQASEISLGLKEKLELAECLIEAGVHQIQAGYPARSENDLNCIKELRRRHPNVPIEAVVQVFGNTWREQIDAALRSGAQLIDLMYPSSDIRILKVQNKTRDEMRARSVEAVKYACHGDATIRFAPTDTTRTDVNFLQQLLKDVCEAGAKRVSVADTAGSATPNSIRYVVSKVREAVPGIPVHVHMHNDFGLALANSLAAVEAGATVIDGTILGIGERAGNTCLDELVSTLQVLYGINLGINLGKMQPLAQLLERLSGFKAWPNKPLIGLNAYSHKLDAHVYGMLQTPEAYEPVPPETFGNVRRFPIGKYTGNAVLQWKLQQLGLNISEDELVPIRASVEKVAIKKQASLSDEELLEIVKGFGQEAVSKR